MGMTLSMEEKVQTAAETVINAPAADETVTGGTTPSEPLSEKRIVHAEDLIRCLPCPRRIVSKGL